MKVWFERRGYVATGIGRLVPGIRTYISLPAGISKMPLVSFLIYSAIGTIFWVSFLTGTGYILGANYERVGTYLKPNTVRLSPPAPKFGGARFIQVPQDWGI